MKRTEAALFSPVMLSDFFAAEPQWLDCVRYRTMDDPTSAAIGEPAMEIVGLEAWHALVSFAQRRGDISAAQAERLLAWGESPMEME